MYLSQIKTWVCPKLICILCILFAMADLCVNLDPERTVDSALVQKYLQTSVEKTEPKPTTTDGAVSKTAKLLDIHPKMVPEKVFFKPASLWGSSCKQLNQYHCEDGRFHVFYFFSVFDLVSDYGDKCEFMYFIVITFLGNHCQ